MQEIRALGHLPNWTEEAPLALRLHRAKASEALSASQLAELEAMPSISKRVTGACATEILMTEIRAFGRCPKRQQVDMKENALAERLRHFKRKKLLSASQLAELRAGSLMEKIRTLGRLPRTDNSVLSWRS